MTKGRRFVPPPDREGIWFRHRGADNSDAGSKRTELTTTGRMLTAPFAGSTQPGPAPPRFSNRAQTLFHTSNPISFHDNKNTIQSRGECFGDTHLFSQGNETRDPDRKLLQPLHRRFHDTGPDFLKHNSRNPVDFDYNTVFSTSYTGRPTDQPPTLRRFRRTRPEPPSGPSVPLSTTTTEWFPASDACAKSSGYPGHDPSTRVLGSSQQPYPKHNSWKYSYQGLPNVYPPYGKPTKVTHVDNIFNRYGTAFTSSGSADG